MKVLRALRAYKRNVVRHRRYRARKREAGFLKMWVTPQEQQFVYAMRELDREARAMTPESVESAVPCQTELTPVQTT